MRAEEAIPLSVFDGLRCGAELPAVTFHAGDNPKIKNFGWYCGKEVSCSFYFLPDLIARDAQGKPYTVRYEAVNAMLLNEFLKAHRRIEEQDKRIEQLMAQLKQQATLLQKVSDKLELKRAAPQMAISSQ